VRERLPVLSVENLRSSYGRIEALHGVSIEVAAGEIVTLVGANGAGKTTLLRAVSGVQPISAGRIRFAGRTIEGVPAHARVALGIVQVPEGRRIFARLTVDENLHMGAFARNDRAAIAEDKERMMALFPRLKERIKQVAGTLSGGEQQMVATARALMARPRILLMDEPSMGLSPVLVEQVFQTIRTINQQGVTILLVEQNALAALNIADYAYVLESGKVALVGRGAELIDDEKVQRAYLG